MPYVSVKSKTIGGRRYERGDIVDTSALTAAKLGSLIRTGLLIQRDEADSVAVEVKEAPSPADEVEAKENKPEGEFCPVCEAGPFKALHMHMRAHENEEE